MMYRCPLFPPVPQNTTKWVKNALRAKGGAGKDDRKAIAEQLKLGQELRAKVCSIFSFWCSAVRFR